MATIENAFVKFTKVGGVLFLLGLRFCGINGNLASVAEDFTEDPVETSSVEKDTTILTFFDPEDVRYLTRETILNYRLENQYSGDSIAIHLLACDFDHDEFIHIYTEGGYINETWGCQDERLYSQENEPYKNRSFKYFAKQYGNGTAIRFVDNIFPPVWVKAGFKTNSTRQSKAKIVVNIYKDIYDTDRNCAVGFFDCYGTYNYCPPCCTDSDQMDRCHVLRCIPLTLKCNGRPNCGTTFNKDEAYETCHPDEPVSPYCKSFSWNYIIMGLAIVVLFIVSLVFALFLRRRIVLARARRERLAQERMADVPEELSRNSPPTDLPPSYEEVCETKEPPSCFCQAVAIKRGSEELQTIQQRSKDISGNETIVDNGSENANSKNGILNQEFHCSCNNVLAEGSDMNGSNNNSQSVY